MRHGTRRDSHPDWRALRMALPYGALTGTLSVAVAGR